MGYSNCYSLPLTHEFLGSTYVDLRTAYVRGKIRVVNATNTSVDYLDTNIYSVIDRLEVSVANQVIDNIPSYNVLLSAMRSMSNSVLNSNIVAYDMLLNGGDPSIPNLSQPIGVAGEVVKFKLICLKFQCHLQI